ncbi:hypothetical protein [Brevundimonas sp.]|uniref:hypothetical protein n=1 Tax=Brevundimonas sp. TaxID=1871086 RepID=UPI0025FD96D3|nr:hypothetical protein [Brevundimonas sp.]
MRMTALLAGAALIAFAAPASAQVVGGVGGNITGGLGVRTGDLGVRDTVRGTTDFARDTVRDARDAARDTVRDARDLDARARADADASADASRNGASFDFDASIGASVRSSGGDNLGQLVGVARNSAGQAQQLLVRGADGVVRGVDATSISGNGTGELMANLTAYQFRRLPQQRSVAPGSAPQPGQPEARSDRFDRDGNLQPEG